ERLQRQQWRDDCPQIIGKQQCTQAASRAAARGVGLTGFSNALLIRPLGHTARPSSTVESRCLRDRPCERLWRGNSIDGNRYAICSSTLIPSAGHCTAIRGTPCLVLSFAIQHTSFGKSRRRSGTATARAVRDPAPPPCAA